MSWGQRCYRDTRKQVTIMKASCRSGRPPRFFATLAGGLIALAATIACANFTEPQPEISVEVEVSRSTVRPGEAVDIVVRARNISDTEFVLPTAPYPPLAYRIFDSNGQRIAPPLEIRFAAITPMSGTDRSRSVLPRNTVSFTHRWMALRNYGVAGEPAEPLAEGDYFLIGGIEDGTGLRMTGDTVMIRVEAQ